MFSFVNFFKGWGNWIVDNPEAAKMAYARAEHCKDCIYAVKGMISQWVGDDLKQIEGFKCDVCSCPLSAKLRSPGELCEHPDGSKWKGISTSEC